MIGLHAMKLEPILDEFPGCGGYVHIYDQVTIVDEDTYILLSDIDWEAYANMRYQTAVTRMIAGSCKRVKDTLARQNVYYALKPYRFTGISRYVGRNAKGGLTVRIDLPNPEPVPSVWIHVDESYDTRIIYSLATSKGKAITCIGDKGDTIVHKIAASETETGLTYVVLSNPETLVWMSEDNQHITYKCKGSNILAEDVLFGREES
jgi:hypothetical protein